MVSKMSISTQSAVKSSDFDKFPYLSDIRILEINNNDVLLLIGTDVPAAHIPIEVRSGDSQDPSAIRLEWIVSGLISSTRTTDEIFLILNNLATIFYSSSWNVFGKLNLETSLA